MWQSFPMKSIMQRMNAFVTSSYDWGFLENASFEKSRDTLTRSSVMRPRAWRSCVLAIFARNSLAALSRSPTSPGSSPSLLYRCELRLIGRGEPVSFTGDWCEGADCGCCWGWWSVLILFFVSLSLSLSLCVCVCVVGVSAYVFFFCFFLFFLFFF